MRRADRVHLDPLDGMKVTTNAWRTYGDTRELDGAVWAGFTDAEVGYVIANEQPGGAVRRWRMADAGAEWSIDFRFPSAVVVAFPAQHAARLELNITLSPLMVNSLSWRRRLETYDSTETPSRKREEINNGRNAEADA